MKEKPTLIIVTLLPPQGANGVQTHFNEIMSAAVDCGYSVEIIHPFASKHRIRKLVDAIARLLRFHSEQWMYIWLRWAYLLILKSQLRQAIKNQPDTLIFYAQDPLSAKAALESRFRANQRVAEVIHFNISEAEEHLNKGIVTHGSYLHRQLMATEQAILPKVDKLFYVSRFMQEAVEARLPATRSVANVVLPNFIEDKSASGPPAEFHGDLITVGTLEARKNQAFVLHVLSACKTKGHLYRLTIIGDGPDRSLLEQLAKTLGIDLQVTFAGFQPNAPRFMANHRLYVHGAKIEAMGIALVEALSYGLPILAAPVGGIPEVFADGKEGFYWQLDDIEQAADKLCELMENKALYREMSQNARARFIQHFSKQALADKWLHELMSS